MTHRAEALAKQLVAHGEPIVSDYTLLLLLRKAYRDEKIKYAREETPTVDVFRRTKTVLRGENIIKSDADYGALSRVISISDASADEIVCLADPFCYISHLSAMQLYGLTDRRPEALFITCPDTVGYRERLKQRFEADYGVKVAEIDPQHQLRPTLAHHPARVRRRPVDAFASKFIGDWRPRRGTFARVASIGQTFLDMLDRPDRCGGMIHVLEVWQEHAPTYLDEIIQRVENETRPILKVRAGYILDEVLSVADARVENWVRFAQRGSSRILDPHAPFAPTFSEKWMISINVG